MSPSLDIIIVNWNAGAQLTDCLRSVAGESGSVKLDRVVVVDNASRDDSLDGIETLGLPLTLIQNKENRGFGAACNQGAKDSRADQLLFLNPDTRVCPEALGQAVACLEGGEGIGIVGVQLVDAEGRPHRSCARFPSFARLLGEMLGLSKLLPQFFHGVFMRDWDHGQSREVDHVMGAFFLTRRNLFESLRGFDERFFVYLEDLDFSLRAEQTGWGAFYLASAQVYHRSGGTSEQVKGWRLSYLLRSRFRYAGKHMGVGRTVFIVLTTFSVEFFLRIAEALVRVSWVRAVETVQGYLLLSRDILRGRMNR